MQIIYTVKTMIPKKIHYCWLSEDPYPEKIQKCIDSWKQFLPDYDIVRWDLKRFPLEKSIWVKQAYENRKYAFAADYIRLYALYTEGGIYLDSDVELLKSFNDLLYLPYFICKENSPQGMEAAVIGAEKGCCWIDKCLAYYEGRYFVEESGKMNVKVLPSIMKCSIEQYYTIQYINNPDDFILEKEVVNVLPCDYFSPKSYVTKKINITNKTYAIHHFAGTWQPFWKKIVLLVWVPFSVKFPNLANMLKKFL